MLADAPSHGPARPRPSRALRPRNARSRSRQAFRNVSRVQEGRVITAPVSSSPWRRSASSRAPCSTWPPSPRLPPPGDGAALALFAGAFAPLVAMLVRLRRRRRGRTRRVVDWRRWSRWSRRGCAARRRGRPLRADEPASRCLTGGVAAEAVGDKRYLVERGPPSRGITRGIRRSPASSRMRPALGSSAPLLSDSAAVYFRFVDHGGATAASRAASLTPPEGFPLRVLRVCPRHTPCQPSSG